MDRKSSDEARCNLCWPYVPQINNTGHMLAFLSGNIVIRLHSYMCIRLLLKHHTQGLMTMISDPHSAELSHKLGEKGLNISETQHVNSAIL